jgi:hypothetical protein
MVFKDGNNNRDIYFHISGKFIIAINNIKTIRPHYGTYRAPIHSNNLTQQLYRNFNFHLNNTIEKFPGFIVYYDLLLYNSEGLKTTDNNTAIEKILKIQYTLHNRVFYRNMISSENKHIVDTNTATASEMFFSKKANSVELDQLEVQKQQAKVSNIGNITRNLIAAGSRGNLVQDFSNLDDARRANRHNSILHEEGKLTGPQSIDMRRQRQNLFFRGLGFMGDVASGGVNIATSIISSLHTSKQIEMMEQVQNLKKMNFQRQIALQSSPIITNYSISNTAFMKEVFKSKYGIYKS